MYTSQCVLAHLCGISCVTRAARAFLFPRVDASVYVLKCVCCMLASDTEKKKKLGVALRFFFIRFEKCFLSYANKTRQRVTWWFFVPYSAFRTGTANQGRAKDKLVTNRS